MIATPAMMVTWLVGLWLLDDGGWLAAAGWSREVRAGARAVGAARAFTRWVKEFAADRNTRPQRFYRVANEVPTLLMIGIVVLAVVKPF